MIFGYISGVSKDSERPELCVTADKPSYFSKPVRIDSLRSTEAGVHLLSIDEGFTVTKDKSDGSITISPVPPCILYITPNLPHKPGFKVDQVRVTKIGTTGEERAFFNRGKGWEPWTPNVKVY
jgi:hypothetical protein